MRWMRHRHNQSHVGRNTVAQSVFGQPYGYMDFRERQPEAAQDIERMMIDRMQGARQSLPRA